jgi:hypothetical protein
MSEVWKAYPNSPYRVSNMGNVMRGNKILKKRINSGGYVYANLSYDGKAEQVAVHQMVLEAFNVPKPKGIKKPVVKHKNNIHEDNKLSNLEWGSIADNTQDAYDDGLIDDKGADNKSNDKKDAHSTGDASAKESNKKGDSNDDFVEIPGFDKLLDKIPEPKVEKLPGTDALLGHVADKMTKNHEEEEENPNIPHGWKPIRKKKFDPTGNQDKGKSVALAQHDNPDEDEDEDEDEQDAYADGWHVKKK